MADTKTPEQKLLEQLESQKKLTTTQSELLTAQSNLLKQAQAGAYDKAAAGKVELEQVEIEAYITATQALKEAAGTIGRKIREHRDYKENEYGKKYPIKSLIIYNEDDATALRQYRVFQFFLQAAESTYNTLLKITPGGPVNIMMAAAFAPSASLVMTGVGVALQSVANILSFFRTDVKVSGVAVTPTESALIAAFVAGLHTGTTQDQYIDVYHPVLFPMETSQNASGIVERLTKLQGQRQEAESKIAKLEQEQTNPPASAKTVAYIGELKAANAAYDKFIGELLTPGEGGAMNNLLLIFRAATLQDKLDKGAHWLHINAPKTGGSTQTETGGIFNNSSFLCSGGAIISFMLVDPDMTIVLSGVETSYTGERSLEDLERRA